MTTAALLYIAKFTAFCAIFPASIWIVETVIPAIISKIRGL